GRTPGVRAPRPPPGCAARSARRWRTGHARRGQRTSSGRPGSRRRPRNRSRRWSGHRPGAGSANAARAYHSRGAGEPADGRRRMIAAVEAWRAGWFKREHWAPNIVAGLIVGVVALPLAMAFAIASGVKPEQGLYTSIIAGV